jgi:hypothetical protein
VAFKRTDSKKPSFFIDVDSGNNTKRDTGIYTAIVKNNIDPTRAGRLQVFIPDFGGNEKEPSHWVTVSYASPFMGAARIPQVDETKSETNDFYHGNHSYGMWMTPPDIGNYVLVTFISGDANQGYWFACIMPDLSHYAIPGQAGAKIEKVELAKDPKNKELVAVLTNPPYPTVEFNEENTGTKTQWNNFLEIEKPVHIPQVRTLLNQGLEDDKIRGVISSSSQRESPSNVFGISTPGRPGDESYAPDKETITNRKGGHTFVMDDGNKDGIDQLIRLRTAGGHQLLMNDKEKVLYIGNSEGTVWMEFTGDGKILMYSKSDFNLRTEGNINFHADESINMYAAKDIKICAGGILREQAKEISLKATDTLTAYGMNVGIKAGGTITAKAGKIYLNTNDVTDPPNIDIVQHKDAKKEGLKYKYTGTKASSIPASMPIPSHEPFDNSTQRALKHGTGGGGGTYATSGSGSAANTSSPNTSSNLSGDASVGPSSTVGQGGIKIRATQAAVDQQAILGPGQALGQVSVDQMTALKAQVGAHESGGKYDIAGGDNGHFLGKYQVGNQVLITQGYVKPGTTGAGLDNPANWTGKDGITSKADYLNNPAIQEKVMDQNLKQNFDTMSKAGVITPNMPAEEVAGKLSAAHLQGAGDAIAWSRGQTPSRASDAFGTTMATYYKEGQYAVSVLSGGKTVIASASQPAVATVVNGVPTVINKG